MPIFEYSCKECDHEFEALVFGKDKAEYVNTGLGVALHRYNP
jgi:putative FmdB family regulatory protein